MGWVVDKKAFPYLYDFADVNDAMLHERYDFISTGKFWGSDQNSNITLSEQALKGFLETADAHLSADSLQRKKYLEVLAGEIELKSAKSVLALSRNEHWKKTLDIMFGDAAIHNIIVNGGRHVLQADDPGPSSRYEYTQEDFNADFDPRLPSNVAAALAATRDCLANFVETYHRLPTLSDLDAIYKHYYNNIFGFYEDFVANSAPRTNSLIDNLTAMIVGSSNTTAYNKCFNVLYSIIKASALYAFTNRYEDRIDCLNAINEGLRQLTVIDSRYRAVHFPTADAATFVQFALNRIAGIRVEFDQNGHAFRVTRIQDPFVIADNFLAFAHGVQNSTSDIYNLPQDVVTNIARFFFQGGGGHSEL